MCRTTKIKPLFLAFLFLTSAVLILYTQTYQFEFVSFDDGDYIVRNPHIQQGLTLQGLKWAFTADLFFNSPNADYWQPIIFVSRMLDISLFGLNPAGHHLMNIVFHLMNTCLVFYLFHTMTGAFWKSLLLALFFSIHPLQAEPVSWVTARKDLLSAFFGLLSIYYYISVAASRSPDSIPIKTSRNDRKKILFLLFFLFGLMSKPVLATLPLLLLIIDFWPLQRLSLKSFLEKWPLILIGFIFALGPILGPIRAISYASFQEVLYNALINYPRYLFQTVYPVTLAILSPDQKIIVVPVKAILSATFLLLITISAACASKHRPYLLVGWLWFAITLLPSSFISTPADRFMYLPLIGLGVIITWGFESLINRFPKIQNAVLFAACAAVITLGVLSFRQVSYWKNSWTIFDHSFRASENNFVAANNLGNVLYRKGRIAEAAEQYSIALKINPNSPKPYFNLANVFYDQKRIDTAISYYLKAIELDPNYAKAHYNMANIFSQIGKKDLAVHHFEEAIRIDSNFAEARQNLAADLVDLGNYQEAEKHLRLWAECEPK